MATLLQAGSAIASGKSVQTRKLEGLYMQAADAYSSGSTTVNAMGVKKLGVSALVALLMWSATKLIQIKTQGREEDRELSGTTYLRNSATPVTAAFFAAFLSVFVFDVALRQKTFSKFTGTNMFREYAMFFAVPLVVFSIGLKVRSSLDVKQSLGVASILAVVAVVVAKNSYFVFKQNDLEKQVFEKIANVLDACQDAGKAGCSHEHAGYVDAFTNMVRPYIDQMNFVLPQKLDAGT